MRPNLNCHAARNFGHRRQERQSAAAISNRFVGNASDFSFEQLAGELRIGRQVKVGKKQLPFAHAFVFRLDRLFDLDDHFGLGPDIIGRSNNLRASFLIKRVFKTRAFTSALFHDDAVGGIG